MRISKKILACVLAALMVIAMMPFTVLAADATVSTGDAFRSAISSASSGDTITIGDDITLSTTNIQIFSKTLTIDLNGHTANITSSNNNGTFYLNGSNLTITDSSANKDGSMIITGSGSNAGIGFNLSSSVLTIESGNVTAVNPTSSGWFAKGINAVYIGSGSTFNMTGGSLTASNATNSGGAPYAVYLTGGTANISGGSIIMDDHDTYGWSEDHLVYKSSGTANITGGKFKSPKALDYSGVSSKLSSAYSLAPADEDGFRAVVKNVAKIGNKGYATLDAAVSAAKEGDTITLIDNVDTSVAHYGKYEFYYYDISGVTLDLNGYTLTERTYSIAFIGENGTIKNGTINCVPDADSRYYFAIGCDMDANPMQKTENIVLEDLVINAGIHVSQCSKVVAKDCDVTGRNYYAVWGDPAGELTIEGGNYSSVDGKALFGTLSDPYDDSYISVKSGNFNVPNGKKLVLEPGSKYVAPQNVTVTGGFYHYDNGNVYAVLERNLGTNCSQNMETGEVIKGEPNNGANITVADEISQNVYIDADFYGQDSYATVVYNHASNASEEADFRTETVQLKDLDQFTDASSAYDGARMLQVIQAPAQSTEPITVKVYETQADAEAGTNVVDTIEYSVYNYCKKIIDEYEGEKAEELKDLAKATLDYAAAAQKYFSYNEANMATKDAAGDYYADVANVNLSSVTGITSRPSEIKNVTVVVKSDLEINLLSKTPVAVNSFSWDATSGGSRFDVNAIDEPNGDWYVINIKGIEPANMDSTITITTNGVPIELTANSIMKIMANSSNANMATLAKAMYLYGQAADAYFG